MRTQTTDVKEILVTGLTEPLSAPGWARKYKTRVVSRSQLGRLRSWPLLTIVRAGKPDEFLANGDFIQLLSRRQLAAGTAAILLLEFVKSPQPPIDLYAQVLARFQSCWNIELAFGPDHAASALVEAFSKIRARKLAVATPQQDPISQARRVVLATSDLRSASGRLAADKIAGAFGLGVAMLAGILGVTRQAVGKSPDAESRQGKLYPFERVARLRAVLSGDEFRKWLWMPNDELNAATPIEWIRDGRVSEIADLVEDMLTGVPA